MNYELRIKNKTTFNFQFSIFRSNGGFTIIETLVAVSILVLAVTGPLSLAAKGLAYSQYAKDEITAFYLANEALDTVRNIRDSNLRSNKEWLELPGTSSGMSDSLLSRCSSSCYFDVWKDPFDIKSNFWDDTDTKVKVCSVGTKEYFGHRFGWDGLDECKDPTNISETIFSRKIRITQITPDEIKVDVLVSWLAKNDLPRSVVLSENLFKLGTL